jgi:MoaD family protein
LWRIDLKIRLKFFALYRDVVGKSQVDMEIDDGWKVKDLVEKVLEDFPAMKKFRDDIIVSVNRNYSSDDTLINEGDDVAIFPPVGGG